MGLQDKDSLDSWMATSRSRAVSNQDRAPLTLLVFRRRSNAQMVSDDLADPRDGRQVSQPVVRPCALSNIVSG